LVRFGKGRKRFAKSLETSALKPDELRTGTVYRNPIVGILQVFLGTPIINQPQVGILAWAQYVKIGPSVIETKEVILLLSEVKMYLSTSYGPYGWVNGALGGCFVKAVRLFRSLGHR